VDHWSRCSDCIRQCTTPLRVWPGRGVETGDGSPALAHGRGLEAGGIRAAVLEKRSQFDLALEDLETAMAVIHAEKAAEDRAAKRPVKPACRWGVAITLFWCGKRRSYMFPLEPWTQSQAQTRWEG
jgi:hypothetical protein